MPELPTPSSSSSSPVAEPDPALPPFLAGGGDIATLIARFDWSRTALGPLAQWPAHVRAATSLMLRAQVPMVMLWQAPGVMIYNAAYGVIAGARHPQLLGSDVREGWPEAADFNDHVMRVGLAGATLTYQDREFTLHRHGRAEQVWLNLDYSPLLDDAGQPVGVMAIVIETTAKVQAERRVRSEWARLTQLFEQAPGFMAVLAGPEHRFESTNAAYLRVTGRTDLIGKTVAEALPDAAEQGYVALLDEVYRNGQPYIAQSARLQVHQPDGNVHERFLDFVYQPIRDTADHVTHIFVTGIDVTERVNDGLRREALARLSDTLRDVREPDRIGQAAGEILGTMLGAGRVGYATIEHDSEVVHIHNNWTAPGIPPVLGSLHLRDYGSFVEDLKRDEIVCIEDVRNDPRTSAKYAGLVERRALSLVNVPVVEQGRLVAMLFVNDAAPRQWSAAEIALIREVTHRTRVAVERVRGEAAMSALDRQFRALVMASSDVVYRVDADWHRMRHLDGRSLMGDMQGPSASWLDTTVPEPERARVAEAVATAIRDKAVFELEHQVLRADGSVGWVFSRAIPILDAGGQIVEWFGAASDMTARKQIELELQDREERLRRADRRKDEFLATLAHELRNPLAPIRNAVHLLGLADREGKHIALRDLLERQIHHMVRLVDDLIEVSRISRGLITLRQEPVSLSSVVDAAVESSRPLIDREGHRLTLRFDGPAPWVQGDAVRLTQLLVNLLNNAARYTDAGGEIGVEVRRDGDDAVLTVADTGIGIAPEQLPRLFELFSQLDRSHSRSQGGLGIGLSLAQTLAQLHGGRLTAASGGLGRGSEFQLRLRAIAAPPVEPAPDPAAQPLSATRILLVDDNRDAADTTGELLRLMGAEVEVVYDGVSALAAVQRQPPDTVLLDIGMPGMDGYEVARRIRAMHFDGGMRPQLIALTGWGQEQDREKTRAAGFDDHMVKPVDTDLLRSKLALPGTGG